MEGWVDLVGLPRWFTCLLAVTHPSSNLIQYRATLLVETSARHRIPSLVFWTLICNCAAVNESCSVHLCFVTLCSLQMPDWFKQIHICLSTTPSFLLVHGTVHILGTLFVFLAGYLSQMDLILPPSFLCGPTLKPDVAAGQCVVNKWNVCCWCASVLEYLTKSDVLNCQHSLYDVMSTSLAQKATLWDFYGHRSASCLGVIEKKKSLRKKIYNRSCESCSIRENVNVLFS